LIRVSKFATKTVQQIFTELGGRRFMGHDRNCLFWCNSDHITLALVTVVL